METCRAGGATLGNEGRWTRPTPHPPKQGFPKYVPKPELGNEGKCQPNQVASPLDTHNSGVAAHRRATRSCWKAIPRLTKVSKKMNDPFSFCHPLPTQLTPMPADRRKRLASAAA